MTVPSMKLGAGVSQLANLLVRARMRFLHSLCWVAAFLPGASSHTSTANGTYAFRCLQGALDICTVHFTAGEARRKRASTARQGLDQLQCWIYSCGRTLRGCSQL